MSREDDDTEEAAAPEGDEGAALDERITGYLRLGVPAGTVVCAAVAGYLQGPPAVVLVLAGGALVGVIAIFWASIRTLVGETPLSGADAYAFGAPRGEEEHKRAVLRALKDLEYEHGLGKISEDDYQALVAKYRAEAKRLLRVLDEEGQPKRDEVEVMVNARLAREGLAPEGAAPDQAKPEARKTKKKAAVKPAKPVVVEKEKTEDDEGEGEVVPVSAPVPAAKEEVEDEDEADDESEAEPVKVVKKAAPRAAWVKCGSCGKRNEADAAFCNKCGASMRPVTAGSPAGGPVTAGSPAGGPDTAGSPAGGPKKAARQDEDES